jgi:transposase
MAESTLTVGMDVHRDTISVAVLRDGEHEPELQQTLPNDPRKVGRFFRKLEGQGRVVSCYEASACGFVLKRLLDDRQVPCEVVAPSLIPQCPGDRRKTDKRDAVKLARLYRAGQLTAVRVPTAAEERVRGAVRCRETLAREVQRSRQHVLKHLLARGVVYRESGNWTRSHWAWLRTLRLEGEDQGVLEAHLALLDFKLALLARADEHLVALSRTEPYRGPVARLRCLKGIDTLGAMTLVCEIGDVHRFDSPRRLMGYVGLTVSEYSSGQRQRHGGITKAGSGRVRRVLVEAAWHYRWPARVSAPLHERMEGQPPKLLAHCLRAQERLHRRFSRLLLRKEKVVAVTAVARELVGFVWAVMHDDPQMWTSMRR